MVERDDNIMCQKMVKNIKLKNKVIIIKQIFSLEAKKLTRTIKSSMQKTKFYNLNKNCNNKEILSYITQKKDYYRIK